MTVCLFVDSVSETEAKTEIVDLLYVSYLFIYFYLFKFVVVVVWFLVWLLLLFCCCLASSMRLRKTRQTFYVL